MTGEQRHHRHTQLHAVFGHRVQAVQAAALDARHAGHVFFAALPFEQEHGQDQVVGRQVAFTHQGPREGVTAQAAGAVGRVRGRGMHEWLSGRRGC
jgi:hypothetical protein